MEYLDETLKQCVCGNSVVLRTKKIVLPFFVLELLPFDFFFILSLCMP